VLRRSKFRDYFTDEERRDFLEQLEINSERVAITCFFQVCRDPKDNMMLELAINGKADYVITRDKDLLTIDVFQGIRIVTPEAFLELS